MAAQVGASLGGASTASLGIAGIDPSVLKFILALIIASIAVEVIGSISRKAAYAVVGLILLLLFTDNPILTGYLNLTSNSLKGALS